MSDSSHIVLVVEHTNPTLPSVWGVIALAGDHWEQHGIFSDRSEAERVADEHGKQSSP